MKIKNISRNCVVCGDKIKINIDEKGKYDNGNYFGKIKSPIEGTGEYKKVGTSKIFGFKKPVPIVKWTGRTKEYEYWECNLCYETAMRENWLENRIEKYYGERCSDFEPSCIVCDTWARYDKIVKNNSLRGNFKQSYDKDADAAYIYIKPKSTIKPGEAVKQLELSDYIILDFDKKQRLLGIEVLEASRRMPKVFAEQKGK